MSIAHLISGHGEDPVVVEGEFRSEPARVFRAWTDPDELIRWFGPNPAGLAEVDVDLRVGGRWRFDYGVQDGERNILHGCYLTIEPDRRLSFSWKHERHFDDGRVERTPESKVEITLKPHRGGTHVRLVHQNITQKSGRLGVTDGWLASYENLSFHLVPQQEKSL